METADLGITLEFINKDVLIMRHGSHNSRQYINPYYGYPALITKKKFIVFDFNAKSTDSTVNFELDEIILEIGEVSGDAKSRAYLNNIWGHYSTSDIRGMDDTMKDTLLNREFTVSPDNPVSGYLVFGENYPTEGGEGLISFDVTTPEGDHGTLESALYFSEDGLTTPKESNSGIFSDNKVQ